MEFAPPEADTVRSKKAYALQNERDTRGSMDVQALQGSISSSESSNDYSNAVPQDAEPQPSLDATTEQVWVKRTLAEMTDMLLLLRPDGTVLYASPSCKWITGYESKQIERDALSRFIHDDDKSVFTRQLEECIATARPLRCHFRFYKSNNTFGIIDAHGHPHVKDENNTCNGVFLVCRPYPTRSSALLDSFLEHKIENIRLNQRISQLRAEEEEYLNSGRQAYLKQYSGSSALRQNLPPFTSYDATGSGEENESSDTVNTDDGEPGSLLESTTQQAQDLAHIDGIEMMTGLRYREGERSHGLSTGMRQGCLVHCNIDIATIEQQARSAQEIDRRKRLKGEYLCTDCGTSDSPEWRKGPDGPKTLCNACGLRWAKKEKKRQESN
ncbi:cutinase gene palindrome-binding protein [Aspergillus udagawae]|uniref:Cutinase gene palindrome-binding protein n=1 Tax=Aspergillus udagawae TaxID=91492 RepID=A0ABQ1AB79_9EURO|nr:cutinase gene palindrome-binding protein [Aspergillus udagawae]GFF77996.1 cutinase gene palindrome-binding protein [Aspergillus udagawae]GFG05370.1 cutinase gene palindrome-binding protein [Aspergillus udagawae]GFG21480.1 cutinase gene palindrome-binding protein [Aspergillus udagawae]